MGEGRRGDTHLNFNERCGGQKCGTLSHNSWMLQVACTQDLKKRRKIINPGHGQQSHIYIDVYISIYIVYIHVLIKYKIWHAPWNALNKLQISRLRAQKVSGIGMRTPDDSVRLRTPSARHCYVCRVDLINDLRAAGSAWSIELCH